MRASNPERIAPAAAGRTASRSTFARLGRATVRYRWLVLAAWAVLVAAGALLLPRFEARLTGPPLDVNGSESAHVQELVRRDFAQPFAEQDVIVFESDRLTIDDLAYQKVIAEAVGAASRMPLVAGVVSPLELRARDQVSADGRVAAAVVGLGGTGAERVRLAPDLIETVAATATEDVSVYLTGRSPLIADMVRQQRTDLARAELYGLPAAMLVLLFASGTLIAAGLPVLLALAGIVVTFGALGAATSVTSFNLFVPNIATMLGLGVGIDYALFLVTRFREELARGADPAEAVVHAVATSGKTVFFSGATVLLSLAGLLLVDASIFDELAIGSMAAVAVMVAGALTLLPAMLALLGHRVERLALPGVSRTAARTAGGGFWGRWARAIMRRPGRWALAASLALVALTAPITRLDLGLSTSTNELSDNSAVKGRAVLARDFNEGRVSPIQVLVVSPDGPLDDGDLAAITRLSAALRADGAVADIYSVTDVLDRVTGGHDAATLRAAAGIPQAVDALGPLVNFGRGRNLTIISVVPYAPPDSDPATQLVRRIRGTIAPAAVGDAGVEVLVGGLGAQVVDISDESLRKLPLVGGLVVALSFILLTVVFRSLLLPLKAIAMNGLSIGAAYGLLVLVFQRSPDAGLFHLIPTGTTQVYLPLLSFAVLFGLSMDYEVFLLGRIKEEWERSHDNAAAVARGLERTARVITSAAAIMVAVFAAFTVTRLPEVQQLGFSLAVAVFIDATLVRIVLVPAAMQFMGRWNWWFPAWLDRIVPRVDLGEASTTEMTAPPAEGAAQV